MQGRRASGVFLAFAIVIGSSVLTAEPAFADTAPSTVPVMTAPTDSSAVAGDVTVSATSTAASVQFFVDSVALGAPVTVDTGTATTDWPTWGLANTSSHTIDAEDCNLAGCNPTTSAAVTVTINNATPSLTAPTAGATTNWTPELDGDTAGGGLAFFVDGVQIGFDATSPFSATVSSPLVDGPHTALVTECDATGVTCDGPSATASFASASLQPQITSVAPNPFSPNRDGHLDTTTFNLSLPDTETVSWVIRNQSDTVVKTGPAPVSLAAGSHAIAWGGANDARTVVPDGVYTLDVSTTGMQNSVQLNGATSANVTLDTVAPTITGITGNNFTFYPVVDHYLDTFVPKATVNEAGTLTLYIFNSAGTIIREIPHAVASPGTVQISWDGRNTRGQTVAAGAFHYEFVMVDKAANRRPSARLVVNVSLKHLVGHTATYTMNGDQRYQVFETAPGCGLYTTSSAFSHGLFMRNPCFSNPNGQAVFAAYVHAVPAAHAYTSVHVKSYGRTDISPTRIFGGVLNFHTTQWDPLPVLAAVNNHTAQWSDYGQVNAANFITGRQVRFGVFVPNVNNPNTDYDVGLVRIIVGYTLLQ